MGTIVLVNDFLSLTRIDLKFGCWRLLREYSEHAATFTGRAFAEYFIALLDLTMQRCKFQISRLQLSRIDRGYMKRCRGVVQSIQSVRYGQIHAHQVFSGGFEQPYPSWIYWALSMYVMACVFCHSDASATLFASTANSPG